MSSTRQMPPHSERILTLKELNTQSLELFFTNQICAIRVPHFAEVSVCQKLHAWLRNNEKTETYHHEIRENNNTVNYLNFGVDRVGVAYNTTYNKAPNGPEITRYYQEALPGIRNLRQSLFPNLSPIDKLRLELDELWPHDANIATFDGKKMFVGIGRVMDAKLSHLSELQPHFDAVPEKLSSLRGQYAANIYLQLPPSGGELEIWDIPPLPISEIDNAELDKDWRSTLPPSLIMKPEQGELILVNTRRPHAIRKFEQGERSTLQCFIGIKPDNAIVFWN